MGAAAAGGLPPGATFGMGISDFGWFAVRAESAEARTFWARSVARSRPAELTDASYFASNSFLSGSGGDIGCTCPDIMRSR